MTQAAERFHDLPALQRFAPVKTYDADTRSVTVMFSAGAQVRRYDWWNDEVWIEELEMSREAVDLSRLNAAAPVLDTHRRWSVREDVVGVVEKAWLEGAEGMARLRFSRRDDVKPLVGDVADGIVRQVSIGYDVFKYEQRGTDPETGYRIMRATKWSPFEISFVPVGADQEAGARARSAPERQKTRCAVVLQPAVSATTEESAMTTEATRAAATQTAEQQAAAAAAAAAAPSLTAVTAEKERREAIQNLCKSNKIDARVETRWIQDGVPLTVVAKEILDVMEERGRARPAVAAELGLSERDTQSYSLLKAIRALKFGAQQPAFLREAAFELECSQAVAKKLNRGHTTSILIPAEILTRSMGSEAVHRAMATTPGAKGGYLVNVENMGFIDILRARSVAMNMGARRLSGLEGNVMFPRQTGKSTVTWQGGEGVSVTATDQALGQLSMTPKTAIIVTDVSEQLLRQSSPSAEQFVMADLAATIAIDGVDNATINGTGGAQPLGIKNTTGVTTGQDAATATYAKILAFPAAAGASNAIRGNPGFVTNIAGAAILMQKQRFSSTDTPLWEGNLLDGQVVGFRAMSSEQLAASNLVFGSWDELVIGEWGVLELATDNGGTRFNAAQVGIRAMWMVDVLLRYPQAFVVSTNLSA